MAKAYKKYSTDWYIKSFSKPPTWSVLGGLAIEQLEQGHAELALALLPIMREKLGMIEAIHPNTQPSLPHKVQD